MCLYIDTDQILCFLFGPYFLVLKILKSLTLKLESLLTLVTVGAARWYGGCNECNYLIVYPNIHAALP